jgi:hypothetical protein
MFANLTRADFGGRSTERRAAVRKHVLALFDEIQVAIYNRVFMKVDYLMAELAEATARERLDDRDNPSAA